MEVIIKKNNFKGGVHPPEYKYFTEHKSIENFPLPEKVYLLLQQHIGAPAKPIVKVGDKVRTGELIAEASGFISANIHASISGEVTGFKEFIVPFGAKVQAIEITSDGEDNWVELDKREWQRLSPKEIIELVKEKGIVGMGGATFPTHVKLSPPPEKKIDTLIINGVECEPYLTADHRLMLEEADKIIDGIKILMYVLGVDKAYIGVEANKMDAIEHLIEKTANDPIEVVALEVKYPQGAEKQLIYAITKREVPSGGLPADVGVVVQNVATAKAIYDAVVEDIPLIERITTVTGSIVKNPTNYRIRVGTLISSILDTVGVEYENIAKLIMGGPMMGLTLYTDNFPLLKANNGILVLSKDEVKREEEYPCISCGRCVDVCPMNLLPTMIASSYRKKEIKLAEKLGALDCIECGSCSYICPAKIPLAQQIKLAKKRIITLKKKAKS